MNNRKLLVALGAPTAAVALTGAAFAVASGWSSSGAGTGTADSTTSADSTISAVTADPVDDLYPGAVTNAYVTVDNPNSYPIVVTSINAAYSRAVGGCAATTVRTDAVSLDASGVTQSDGTSVSIAPGETGTYKLVLRMSNNATDACKSQTFTLGGSSTDGTGNFTATVNSAATTSGNDF